MYVGPQKRCFMSVVIEHSKQESNLSNCTQNRWRDWIILQAAGPYTDTDSQSSDDIVLVTIQSEELQDLVSRVEKAAI